MNVHFLKLKYNLTPKSERNTLHFCVRERKYNESLSVNLSGKSTFISKNKTGKGPLDHPVYTWSGLRDCIVLLGAENINAKYKPLGNGSADEHCSLFCLQTNFENSFCLEKKNWDWALWVIPIAKEPTTCFICPGEYKNRICEIFSVLSWIRCDWPIKEFLSKHCSVEQVIIKRKLDLSLNSIFLLKAYNPLPF
jgi:hypothetical protein